MLGALLTGTPPGARAGAMASAAPPTCFAAKGLLAAVLDALRVDWPVEAGTEPFLHPGRAGRGPRRRRARRLGRRGPSAGRARVGHRRAGRGVRDRPRARRRAGARGHDLSRPDELPGAAPGHRGRRRRRRPAARVLDAGARRRRRAARAAPDLRRLRRRAAGGAAGRSRSRCTSSSARPTARSPTRTSRRCARRSSPRCATSWEVSCVADRTRPRRRASGYAGALAARLVDRHPQLELVAVTVAQRRRPPARRALPAPPRAARARRARPRRRAAADVDAAIVAYPHGAAAPVVAELHERGDQGRRPLGRLPPARPRDLRGVVRRAPAPELIDEAVYGLPELLPRAASRGADLVANPGCFPTAALLALAPLRAVPEPTS